MSLFFLAPAVLGLGLLLAGPLLAHLSKRQPRDRRPFGALMLVERLQRRLHRRRRLQDRLLLLLRLLAIAIVVLAAAQPQARWVGGAPTFGGTGNVLFILDNSLSMDQRVLGDSAFALAQKDAAAQARTLAPGVRVAVISVGGTATLVSGGFTEDAALAASQLESVAQSYGGTDLRGAFLIARTLLEGAPGEVLVYTDESGPGVVDGCAGDIERLLALGSSILPRIFGPGERRNVAPVSALYGDGLEGGTVTVELWSWGAEAREVPTTVSLPDGAQITAFIQVPGATEAGPGVAEGRFTVPRQAMGGVARVEIEDPDLVLDNVRYFHLPRIGASRVLVVDGDPGSTPTRSEVYFLERALAPWGSGGVAVDVVSSTGIGRLDPEVYGVAFLANVADPAPYAPQLIDFVRRGGGLVLGMGDNVTPERYDTALASLLPSPLRKTRDLDTNDSAEGEPLRPPDVGGTPLFRAFARVGREGFGRVRSRRVMTTEPLLPNEDVRVLLEYASGVPALIERRIGSGRVLLWTSSFDLGWTNLPLQSVFMPFVQRITGYLGGDAGAAATTSEGGVDSPVTLGFVDGAVDPEVSGPDGAIMPSERGIGSLTFTPRLPGAYSAVSAGLPALAWVAVNIDPEESDVTRGTSLIQAQAQIAPERLHRTFELGLPLLAVGVGMLLGAGLLGRGRNEDA